eukprot:CFRG7489T1
MAQNPTKYQYVFCHGFASNNLTYKGCKLRDKFKSNYGIDLHVPDLNTGPDFSTLTFTGAIETLHKLDEQVRIDVGRDFKWRMIGSSLGGYLSVRFAELYPDRVDKCLLICPAFNIEEWMPSLIAKDGGFAKWEADGQMPFPNAAGVVTQIPWNFMKDARTHPVIPKWSQETVIIHGTEDEIIPVDFSRRVVNKAVNTKDMHVQMIEVHDNHAMCKPQTLLAIQSLAAELFGLKEIV